MILLLQLLRLVQLVVVARVLMTWIYPNPAHQPFRAVTQPIDKVLKPFRVTVPLGGAMLDLGPLLFLLLIEGLQRVLIALIMLT